MAWRGAKASCAPFGIPHVDSHFDHEQTKQSHMSGSCVHDWTVLDPGLRPCSVLLAALVLSSPDRG